MESTKQRENQLQRATVYVDQLQKFYGHLFTFIVAIAFLGGLNFYLNGFRNPWVLWVLFGWGIGLIIHGTKTLAKTQWLGHRWRTRKIKEYMDKNQ